MHSSDQSANVILIVDVSTILYNLIASETSKFKVDTGSTSTDSTLGSTEHCKYLRIFLDESFKLTSILRCLGSICNCLSDKSTIVALSFVNSIFCILLLKIDPSSIKDDNLLDFNLRSILPVSLFFKFCNCAALIVTLQASVTIKLTDGLKPSVPINS